MKKLKLCMLIGTLKILISIRTFGNPLLMSNYQMFWDIVDNEMPSVKQRVSKSAVEKHAYSIYRATMARTRFENILRFLRFDSVSTRAIRRETDKGAPIREIFEKVVSNLENHYLPHECITVDEQLYGFRGRTPFTQYIPSKPAKYGIKIWWACDSKAFYPLCGQLYVGKVNNVRDLN